MKEKQQQMFDTIHGHPLPQMLEMGGISPDLAQKNRVFHKGLTAVLFSIFSFGHVLQYAPFSLHLNALHFIPL